VGATRFSGQKIGNPEMASVDFGSGGGFSFMFPAFDAQRNATASYLANAPDLPPAGSYPPAGRGTADISALGEGYQVFVNGKVQSIGGTSASAPAFAGLVSLLNEERLKHGKPAMGFLNPWLYANPQAFTDVVDGTNAIGRGTGPLKYGYECTKGWDPATGLGTPIFSKMLDAAMQA
jgi:tripeptidyl-peptidase-1